MATPDERGKSDLGKTGPDVPLKEGEEVDVKAVVVEKAVEKFHWRECYRNGNDDLVRLNGEGNEVPVDVNELDPDEVFGPEEGERRYTDSELARKERIDYNKPGYRGWKDAYLNDEGDYVRLNGEGDEVYYDGSLDSDSAWNRQFDSSSSDDNEVTSTSKGSL